LHGFFKRLPILTSEPGSKFTPWQAFPATWTVEERRRRRRRAVGSMLERMEGADRFFPT